MTSPGPGPFLFCIDLETFMIEPGGGSPPPVCGGWTCYDDGALQSGVVHVNGDAEGDWTPASGDATPALAQLYRWGIERVRAEAAKGRTARFVNHNIVFDLAVVCAAYADADPSLISLVFQAYDEGIIEDTMIREQLIDIAAGSLGWVRGVMSPRGTKIKRAYTLKDLAKRRLNEDLDKTTWRTGYASLVDVPLAQWPQGAKDYAIDDTGYALGVYLHQRDEAMEDIEGGEIPNSIEQARAHWALYLMSVWGIRTDGARVARYKHELELRLRVFEDALKVVGFIRAKEGTKDKKLIETTILELHDSDRWPAGHELARTEKGAVSMKAQSIDDLLEALDLNLVPAKAVEVDGRKKEPVEFALDLARKLPVIPGDVVTDLDGHPMSKKIAGLALLAWHTSTQKLLGTYIPPLEDGSKYPINCRYQPLVASGRTSCTSPNLQNLPKERGVRECYRARPGMVFSSVDYEALELHTLAQACLTLLGKSKLAEALNDGVDPHLLFAVEQLIGDPDLNYDTAKKIRKDQAHPRNKEIVHARNTAKAALFGLPGGLGAPTFVAFCKASGILITIEQAIEIKKKWMIQFPEMRDYFKKIASDLRIDDNGEEVASVEQLFSARIRGGARYTAACNSVFQGLGSDVGKAACYDLAKACYVPGHNPILYGSRTIVFVHDETIMEHPIETAHERAMEQARIMVEAGKPFCPDVPLKAEPALMYYWSKDAVAVYDENKRLVPWVPSGAT